MSEDMDIDTGYDTREREASPRRDRDVGDRQGSYQQRDRSPRRGGYGRGDDRGSDRSGFRGGDRGGFRGGNDRGYSDRRFNDRRSGPPNIPLEELKDTQSSSGNRDTDRNYSNSVFIGNLGYDCDSRALRDHFAKVGSVVRADIITQGGRHRGMATVEFSNREECDRAIQEFHHTQFRDREIFVRHDNPPPGGARQERSGDRFNDRSDRFGDRGGRFGDRNGGSNDRFARDRFDNRGSNFGGSRSDSPFYEVFVGNLPFRVRWQNLKDMFRECGTVSNAIVKQDEQTGRSRGFGFVYFDKQEDAQAAIEKFDGYELEGRALTVHEGKKSGMGGVSNGGHPGLKNSPFTDGVKAGGERGDTIHVNNLPFATTNQDLLDLFGTVGSVTQAEIIAGADGRPAGAAVVQFDTPDTAEQCISRLNGYDYGGRNLDITFAQRV